MKKYIILTVFIFSQNSLPFFTGLATLQQNKYRYEVEKTMLLKTIIQQGNIEKVKRALALEKIPKEKLTQLLFFAVEKKQYNVAKLLLDKGAPVAYATDISKEIVDKIRGKSFKKDIAKQIGVGINNLAHLKIVHFGFDNKYHIGEMIINKKVVKDAIGIFTDICKAQFPIKKIRLIDDYDADDDLSMGDNNGSALCQRYITGSTSIVSNHSYGTAIDINPIENPYVKGDKVYPPEGRKYIDREQNKKGLIKPGDPCHEAFTKRGWDWGGRWMPIKGYVDYQHFAKDPKSLK